MRVGNRASPALLTSPQSWRRSTVRSQIARAHPVKLTGPAGRSSVVEQDTITVGKAADAVLRLQGAGIAAEHAVIQVKGKHVFCRPCVREEDNPIADTHTWLDGQPLRQEVAYVVPSGAQVAFGVEQQAYKVEYAEGAATDPMADMLLQGWSQRASADMQEQIRES